MHLGWRWLDKAGKRTVIGVPYAWLLVFFALPFLILLRLSVTDMDVGVESSMPLPEGSDGGWHGRDGPCTARDGGAHARRDGCRRLPLLTVFAA